MKMHPLSPQSRYSISSFGLNQLNSSLLKLKMQMTKGSSFLRSYDQTSTSGFSKVYDTKSIILPSSKSNKTKINLKKISSQKLESPKRSRIPTQEEDLIKKLFNNNISIKLLNQKKTAFNNIPNIKPLPYNSKKTVQFENSQKKIEDSIKKLSFVKKIYDCVYSNIVLERIKNTSSDQNRKNSDLLNKYCTYNKINKHLNKSINVSDSVHESVVNPEGNTYYKLPFMHKLRKILNNNKKIQLKNSSIIEVKNSKKSQANSQSKYSADLSFDNTLHNSSQSMLCNKNSATFVTKIKL